MATSDAPVEIGHVALVVRDLPRVSAYYRDVIGLAELSRDGEVVRMGAGDRVLLELRQDKAARPRDPRSAGLFHTAFLLPRRADLGNWLRHIAATRAPVQGASDHLVSEAIYLGDPEGNGIEVYVDRPRSTWQVRGNEIAMATEQLDIDDLFAAADGEWRGMPEGGVVGHVHLQVGAIPAAEGFYTGPLGMDLTARYPGGSFFSSGGYHHHLATNVWNSRNAPPLTGGATGLAELVLRADAPALTALARQNNKAGREIVLADPSNIAIRIVEKDMAHAG